MSDNFLEIDKSKYSEIKQRYQLPEEYIFTLGNTNPKKNLPNVLKAYIIYHKSADKPLPLILADEPPSDVFKMLSVRISGEVEKDIRFIGYVKNLDIPLLYAFSRMFIYASIRESFGIPILEGMAAGVPVITSNVSCMPEIAGDAASLVNPHNPSDIAAGIHKILDDRNYVDDLIEKGYARTKHFSWNISATKVLEIYKELYSETKDRKSTGLIRKLVNYFIQ
jgi:glycosyltransferase involved in cell wall biosynthesis